jgi:fatty-acyl-CoA synthase
LANAFLGAGLRVGDRIAILAKNRLEYVLTYFAASKAGVVPVPLNYRLSPPQWAAILGDAQPRLLIAEPEFIAAIDSIRGQLRTVEHFVALDAAGSQGWAAYTTWTANQSTDVPALQIDVDADLYQRYTSGTTGLPKGAILTHRSVIANTMQIGLAHRGVPGERSLVVLPLFHAATVPTTFSPLAWGGTLYILEQFDPLAVIRALSDERISFATLVPAMIQTLLGVPDVAERSYEQLRTIYYGASPISDATLQHAMQIFPCGFLQSYGMTEATQAVTFLQPADHRRAMAGQPGLLLSAGRPAVGTEVRIVDANGSPLPAGVCGEIVVRGPQLMKGYWNRPEETAAAQQDGGLYTGDAGMLDDAGYLYVQDRIKDMIVSGGENVFPSVVEQVLQQHPTVAEAAVIGVPDPRWGETVKAIVVLKPEAAASAEELIAFCRDKLAGFERPRSVDFVDALPRTPTGKVLKRVLREPFWAGQSRRVAGV